MDARVLFLFAIVLFLCTGVSCQMDDGVTDVIIAEHSSQPPKPIVVNMFTTELFTVNVSFPCDEIKEHYKVTAESANNDVFRIHGNKTFILECIENEISHSYDVTNSTDGTGHVINNGVIISDLQLTIEGKLIGISNIVFIVDRLDDGGVSMTSSDAGLYPSYDDKVPQNTLTYEVFVLRLLRPIDKAFMIFVPIFLFIVTIGFGCKLDLGIVKECLKKPVAPGIGLGCQYVIMPLIGFSIAKLLPNVDHGMALGIFVCGICPGGGVSNIYTYLLDGDVSLSITMTFLSTIASLVMMPLWLYTFGTLFITEQFNITIPWINLIQIIALIVVPLFVGIFIKYKFLKVAIFIIKVLKPLTLCFIILMTIFGIYSNWFIFKLFKPLHIIAGCLLPYLGYLFGGAIAAIFRQPLPRVKAIALETGMQNVGVAYILMISSLAPPHGDLASVAPMASAMMTPLPPFLLTIIYVLYKKCCKKYEPVNVEETEVNVTTRNGNTKDGDVILTEKLSAV